MPARVAALALLAVATACGDDAGRTANRIAELRDRAADGIEAIDRFCAARDTVILAARRGDPGAERALQQVLLAPIQLDDYCEEFRFHGDDDHGAEPAADTAAVPPADADTALGRDGR